MSPPTPKPPSSITFTVKSDVLGRTAVSVPLTPLVPRGPDDAAIYFSVERAAIDDAVDERETAYLDSHQAKVNPFEIDRDELRRIANRKVNEGEETWATIAARIGWIRPAPDYEQGFAPDAERVKHILGFREDRPNAKISLQDAEDLCKGLEIDPVDIGL